MQLPQNEDPRIGLVSETGLIRMELNKYQPFIERLGLLSHGQRLTVILQLHSTYVDGQ